MENESYKPKEIKPYFSREEEKEMLKKVRDEVMPYIVDLEAWRRESLNSNIRL